MSGLALRSLGRDHFQLGLYWQLASARGMGWHFAPNAGVPAGPRAERPTSIPRLNLKANPTSLALLRDLRLLRRCSETGAGAVDGASEDALDDRATDGAKALRQRGLRVAVVLPLGNPACMLAFDGPVVGILYHDQRQGELRTGGLNNLGLSGGATEKALDFDVVRAIHQEVWCVGVFRLIRQPDGESVRLVLVRRSGREQVPGVVRLPSGTNVVPDVEAEAVNPARPPLSLASGRWAPNLHRCRTLARAVPSLRGWRAIRQRAAALAGEVLPRAATLRARRAESLRGGGMPSRVDLSAAPVALANVLLHRGLGPRLVGAVAPAELPIPVRLERRATPGACELSHAAIVA